MRTTLLLVCVPLLVTASGCGAGTDLATALLLPIDQEVELGNQFAQEIEAELVIHSDPVVQAYIDDLGRRVLAAVDPPPPAEIDWNFRVVDDVDTVNAFALPGGHIYFYSGLMAMADNEAEIAAVMGHEIAHVTRRHGAERLVSLYGIDTVAGLALGSEPSTLGTLVTQVVQTGTLITYGRSQETEADTVGIEYVIDAGYDPIGFITFFEKLEALQGGIQIPEFLSTHPHPENRIENIESILENRNDIPTRLDGPNFDDMQSRL